MVDDQRQPKKHPTWKERNRLQKVTTLTVLIALTCGALLSVGPESNEFELPVRVVGAVALVVSLVLLAVRFRRGER